MNFLPVVMKTLHSLLLIWDFPLTYLRSGLLLLSNEFLNMITLGMLELWTWSGESVTAAGNRAWRNRALQSHCGPHLSSSHHMKDWLWWWSPASWWWAKVSSEVRDPKQSLLPTLKMLSSVHVDDTTGWGVTNTGHAEANGFRSRQRWAWILSLLLINGWEWVGYLTLLNYKLQLYHYSLLNAYSVSSLGLVLIQAVLWHSSNKLTRWIYY